MKTRIRSTHIHDNDGKEDKHLFPFVAEGGTIDWPQTDAPAASRPEQYPLLLELKEAPGWNIRSSGEADLRAAGCADRRGAGAMSETPRRIRIADAGKHVGEEVQLAGWLYNLRKSGKIVFPQLRDGSGIMQCVGVKSELPEEVFETLKHLTQESSLILTGTDSRGAACARRVRARHHGRRSAAARCLRSDPYPITPKEHGIEFLMDHRHLWLRSRRQHAIIRVRHEVIRAIRDYFDDNGFVLVDTPIFTPAACEGTTTLFEVDYFEDEKVYLTQSGQLYNEANAMAFGKVYCFGPTFRAEKSKTRRHLTEFWMVEPEMAFADLEDVKRVAEDMVVVRGAARAREPREAELKVLERDTSEARKGEGAVPAHELRRRGEEAAGEGQRDSVGRRFRQHRRNAAHRGSRSSR